MSIPEYSKARPSDSLLVKLLVAEYRPRMGMPRSPASDERLMTALFLPRQLIPWIKRAVSTAMEVQLMLMRSTILWWGALRWQPTQFVPTLLTRRQISSPSSYFIMLSTFSLFEESWKLKAIVLNSDFFEPSCCRFLSRSTVELNFSGFLEMRTILKPIFVKTLQKPRPMPSVAPVTTAQLCLSVWQYLFLRSGMGRKCLTMVLTRKVTNLKRGQPKRTRSIRQASSHSGRIEKISMQPIIGL